MADVVTVERYGRVELARCHGELDLAVRDDLREGLLGLPSREIHTLVLDLSDVTFMDCTAVGALAALARECARHEVRLLLAGLTAGGRRLLEALDLTDVFVIVPAADAVALAEAWASLAGRPDGLLSPFRPPPHRSGRRGLGGTR